MLLIAFNRPELVQRSIDRLRLLKAQTIFVSVDGPRPGRGDEEKVDRVKELIASIDWTTDVHVRASDVNRGCGRGPYEAITWFFENVEAGYILEDDILPTRDFFGFCHVLLDRYADDDRVLSIGGNTYVPPQECSAHAYRFSRFAHVSGWATWRSTWQQYQFDISDWRRQLPWPSLRAASGNSRLEALYWRRVFDQVAVKGLDAWDAQLEFLGLRTRRWTALPNVCLIENLGFGGDSTHTHRRPSYVLPSGELNEVPMPIVVHPDAAADRWESRHVLGATPVAAVRKAIAHGLRNRRGPSGRRPTDQVAG